MAKTIAILLGSIIAGLFFIIRIFFFTRDFAILESFY